MPERDDAHVGPPPGGPDGSAGPGGSPVTNGTPAVNGSAGAGRLDGETVRIDLGRPGLDGATVRIDLTAGRRAGRDRSDLPHVDEDGPLDLGAVRADDALLTVLGGGGPGAVPDDPLADVLTAWRREVDGRPVGELVDTDTALTVLARARRPAARPRLVGPLAAAAAVLVIAFSGVGLVAKSAEPGDRLWNVAQVLYSGYADSVEAAAAVRTDLQQARDALAGGRPGDARALLDRAEGQVSVVGEDEGRAELQTRVRQLAAELSALPPVPGPVEGTELPSGAVPTSTPAVLPPAPTPTPTPDPTGSTPPSAAPTTTTPAPVTPPPTTPQPTTEPLPSSPPVTGAPTSRPDRTPKGSEKRSPRAPATEG